MKLTLAVFHLIGVLIAFTLCVFELAVSVSEAGHEPSAITYERASVAVLCGLFSAAHFLLIKTRKLVAVVATAFYPLGIALAITTSLVSRSSAKEWAPSSDREAFVANLLGYSAVTLLFMVCIATCVWAYKKNSPNT